MLCYVYNPYTTDDPYTIDQRIQGSTRLVSKDAASDRVDVEIERLVWVARPFALALPFPTAALPFALTATLAFATAFAALAAALATAPAAGRW